MRGHKYIVVVIVFDCANSPLKFQIFTKHKFLIRFRIDTKGQMQATSEVKCQLMSSMAAICFRHTVIQSLRSNFKT